MAKPPPIINANICKSILQPALGEGDTEKKSSGFQIDTEQAQIERRDFFYSASCFFCVLVICFSGAKGPLAELVRGTQRHSSGPGFDFPWERISG